VRTSFAQPDQALFGAVARAHSWLELILDGKVNSTRQLAWRAKVGAGYVQRVLRLAFLSPALTAAILDGRQLNERLSTHLLQLDVSRSWRLQVPQFS
jgi:site-specific DNA recombinase